MAKSITAQRATGRVRQQHRRDKLTEAKTPTTHTINRALVEALMQCVEINRKDGVHRMLSPVTLNQVLPRAVAILSLGASATSSYDVEEVIRVIRERTSKHPDSWRIDRTTARMHRDDILT
jgi:hypothetical protein